MTIKKSIHVQKPVDVAFRTFTEEIGQWWPKGPSFGGKLSKDMFMEGRLGGRFYQLFADGTEFEIGRVTAYQPPTIVAFTWRAPSWDMVTQVEVRFIADGTGTRVELAHGGWEQTAQLRDARTSYEGGWDIMLGHYRTHAGSAA